MAALAASEVIIAKEIGIGTALAVLIDATITRALLVVSLMTLLGRRNWWAPALRDRRAWRRFETDSAAGAVVDSRFEAAEGGIARVAERLQTEQFLDASQQ